MEPGVGSVAGSFIGEPGFTSFIQMVEGCGVGADGNEIEVGGFVFFFEGDKVGVEVFDFEFDELAFLDQTFGFAEDEFAILVHAEGGVHDAIFGGCPDLLNPSRAAVAFPVADHEIELFDFGYQGFGGGWGLDDGCREQESGDDHGFSLTVTWVGSGQFCDSLAEKWI